MPPWQTIRNFTGFNFLLAQDNSATFSKCQIRGTLENIGPVSAQKMPRYGSATLESGLGPLTIEKRKLNNSKFSSLIIGPVSMQDKRLL